MRKIIVILNTISLFILPTFVAADQIVLEVIQLKYRTTSEIIPLIDPFLDNKDTLKGIRNKLIIRTSLKNLKEIKKLLNEIDKAPRQLIITVKQDVNSETARKLLRLSGKINKGETQVKISGNTGKLISNNNFDKNRLKVQVLDSHNFIEDKNTQSIQVLDGGHAVIHIGKSLPITLRNSINTPQGTRVIENTQFRDAKTGFIVRPSVIGNNVTLEIYSQQNTSKLPSQGIINVQQIRSLISGKLGEWMHLGQIESVLSKHSFSPNSPFDDRITSKQHMTLIKVDEIR